MYQMYSHMKSTHSSRVNLTVLATAPRVSAFTWRIMLASACGSLTQTITMASDKNPAEVLLDESQRLQAFADFWRLRYALPEFVT